MSFSLSYGFGALPVAGGGGGGTGGGTQLVALPIRVRNTDTSAISQVTMRANDTAVIRSVQVVDSKDIPINLTGWSAVYILRQQSGDGTHDIESAATVTDSDFGYLKYQFADDETGTPGLYYETWRLTDTEGNQVTVPGGDNIIVLIREI